jgi:hypothetical protein
VRLTVAIALAAEFCFLVGCTASVRADSHLGDQPADYDQPVSSAAPPAPTGSAADAPSTRSLLGERQDLGFKGPATANCQCLAVAVGQPGDPAFQWSGNQPKTDPNAELVIALSSAGQACPEAGKNTLGASYWGYEVVGSDVVVVVENAAPGRPLASGAIIPRPMSGGQVFVRPEGKAVPYGRSADGSGRCRVSSFASEAAAKSPSEMTSDMAHSTP